MDQDKILNSIIKKNLHYWNNAKWNRNDILNYFKNNLKEKRLYFIEINDKKINYKHGGGIIYPRFEIILGFLNSVVNIYPNLKVTFLISIGDEIYDTDIVIHDLRTDNEKVDDPKTHSFKYGISQQDNNILRIEKSKDTVFNFPIFSFSKTEKQKEVIIMPHMNLIKNNFINDNTQFENKIPKVLYRFTNIRANLFMPSRYKLLELTYKYPELLDSKGCCKELKHKYFGEYIIHPTFVNVYKKLNIIDNNIDTDTFLELTRPKHYMTKEEMIKYKFLICNDSWYNCIDYANTNSVLLRYKCDKSKYYEDYIFEDNIDYFIFDETNYIEKHNYITNNDSIVKESIINRKKKIKDYLIYSNLIKHVGYMLTEFSKIQERNEL